jgi:hypothetical protein
VILFTKNAVLNKIGNIEPFGGSACYRYGLEFFIFSVFFELRFGEAGVPPVFFATMEGHRPLRQGLIVRTDHCPLLSV